MKKTWQTVGRWGSLAMICASTCAIGCGGPITSTADAFATLSRSVQERSGHDVFWQQDVSMDDAVSTRIAKLMRSELTEDEAVQLALLNSSVLQAQFETLALVHGEGVTKTTLQNPFVTLLGRFSTGGGPYLGEFNLLQNMLGLFLLPWQREQATINMEQARLDVTQTVLSLVRDVRVAYYHLQAAEQVSRLRRAMLAEVQAASELEDIRSKSRQVDDINVALGRATYQQLKLDLARNELHGVHLREALVGLLGLEQGSDAWRISQAKPLPAHERSRAGLEALALQQRSDLLASQARVQLYSDALHLTESSRFVGSILVGGAITGGPDGVQQAGPTLVLELPVFNRRQGQIESLRASVRRAQQETRQLRVKALSQVRRALQTVASSRAMVEPFAEALVPMRRLITEMAVRKMEANVPGTGAWDVVLARQAELQTQCEWVEAVRDYWQARAELAHAVGTDIALP